VLNAEVRPKNPSGMCRPSLPDALSRIPHLFQLWLNGLADTLSIVGMTRNRTMTSKLYLTKQTCGYY
jgi:hypothetical protein